MRTTFTTRLPHGLSFLVPTSTNILGMLDHTPIIPTPLYENPDATNLRPIFFSCVCVRLVIRFVSDLSHKVGDEEEMADPAVRRPEPEMLTVRGGPLSRLSVFTFNAPMAFSVPLADLYDARMAEVGGRESTVVSGVGKIGNLRGGGRGGEEDEEGEEEEHQHVRFEHRADRVRKLPPLTDMRHVGVRRLEGSGVVEDTGVLMGTAIAIGGVVAAMIAAAAKIVNSH